MKQKNKPNFMMAWVSLIHSSSYLLLGLSKHLENTVGMTLSEQDMLARLNGFGGEAKMVALAEQIFVTKAGMTKMVDRLEIRGWVKRLPSKTDKRVKIICMTKKGQAVLKHSWQHMRPWIKENFADNLSPSEIDGLEKTLKNFLENSGHWDTMAQRLRFKKN